MAQSRNNHWRLGDPRELHFLKLEREFPVAENLTEVADQIRKDEEELFHMLGVEDANE